MKHFSPFYTHRVTEAIFKTSKKFRKLNKWKKQLVRDVFKPFMNKELYNNAPKSIIYPYDKWFENDIGKIFTYLKTSKILRDNIDLELLEKEIKQMPDFGYFLVQLLGLAAWYDTNWNKENIKNYYYIFI